jgi:pilus assembly protein Flp/PilA
MFVFNLKKESIMNFIKNFLREEEGVTAIEYGLIAALISVIIVGNVTTIGNQLNAAFTSIVAKLPALP